MVLPWPARLRAPSAAPARNPTTPSSAFHRPPAASRDARAGSPSSSTGRQRTALHAAPPPQRDREDAPQAPRVVLGHQVEAAVQLLRIDEGAVEPGEHREDALLPAPQPALEREGEAHLPLAPDDLRGQVFGHGPAQDP